MAGSIGDYERNLASVLLELVDKKRSLMTAVSTGGPRIDEVNDEYKERRSDIAEKLIKLSISNSLDPRGAKASRATSMRVSQAVGDVGGCAQG